VCFALSSKLCFSNTSVKNYGVQLHKCLECAQVQFLNTHLEFQTVVCLEQFFYVNLLMRWKLIMFDSEAVDRDKELLNYCCF
jgi:hypothetical protein